MKKQKLPHDDHFFTPHAPLGWKEKKEKKSERVNVIDIFKDSVVLKENQDKAQGMVKKKSVIQ